MTSVNEFLRLLDERTLAQVEQKRTEVALYQNLLIASILLALLVITASLFFIFRGIMRQVGGEPRDVMVSMQEIADGDLTKSDSTDKASQEGLAYGLLAMSDTLNETISGVKKAANEVAQAAEALSVVSAQTNSGITQQLSDVEQVATAMNEMSSTVTEVARSAEDTSGSVESANNQVTQVNDVVNNVISNTHSLSEEINSISDVIQELETESNNIGSVLGVIGEIADQTNLLALNAAIEAARAGEQGRGFAVVADEVRTLASRTQTSTSEIQEIITSLQLGAQRAASAMQNGLDRVSVTVSEVEAAGENLQQIAESVSDINDKSMMIASASSEQQSVAEEIDRNLMRINEVANESANGSGQVESASRQLTELATNLQTMVAKFSTSR